MAAPKYSTGKHAWGVCDRCGVAVKHNELRALTVNRAKTNLLVCNYCYETDHPQYLVGRVPVVDPEAIRNARPDSGDVPSRVFQWGWAPVGFANVHGLSGLEDMLEAVGEVGTVTVSN